MLIRLTRSMRLCRNKISPRARACLDQSPFAGSGRRATAWPAAGLAPRCPPAFLPPIQRGPDPIKERDLRPIAAETDWQKQRRLWRQLLWRRPNDTARSISAPWPNTARGAAAGTGHARGAPGPDRCGARLRHRGPAGTRLAGSPGCEVDATMDREAPAHDPFS